MALELLSTYSKTNRDILTQKMDFKGKQWKQQHSCTLCAHVETIGWHCVFLYCFPPCIRDMLAHWSWSLPTGWGSWPASSGDPSTSLTSSALSIRFQVDVTVPSFYVGARDINLGPYVWAADSFLAELPAQAPLYFWESPSMRMFCYLIKFKNFIMRQNFSKQNT